MLVAAFQASLSEETVGSLSDTISSRDQGRLEQVLIRAQPYDTLREAYYVTKGLAGLGVSSTNTKVRFE